MWAANRRRVGHGAHVVLIWYLLVVKDSFVGKTPILTSRLDLEAYCFGVNVPYGYNSKLDGQYHDCTAFRSQRLYRDGYSLEQWVIKIDENLSNWYWNLKGSSNSTKWKLDTFSFFAPGLLFGRFSKEKALVSPQFNELSSIIIPKEHCVNNHSLTCLYISI